ncbi:MAG: helix-turn-helix transcriptional regulator [Clostridia bacterium]|nr:helix-turn-helix transcriptional regulator [Clostridia bacterium]
MGYNVSYFCTMFKENFGMPFKQYLNAHRIEYAKTWYRGLPLTEMAEKLGFSDYNYFARVFRQQTGMTPIEYFGRK